MFLGQECVTNPKERLRERLHDDWPVPVSKRVSQSGRISDRSRAVKRDRARLVFA